MSLLWENIISLSICLGGISWMENVAVFTAIKVACSYFERAFLEGRTLLGITLAVRPLEFQLRFEGDVTLVVRPYKRAPLSDPLWHLYTGDQYLGLVAGRRLFYRRFSKSLLRSVAAAPVDVAF